MLALQRTAGNRAVAAGLTRPSGPALQRVIGSHGDGKTVRERRTGRLFFAGRTDTGSYALAPHDDDGVPFADVAPDDDRFVVVGEDEPQTSRKDATGERRGADDEDDERKRPRLGQPESKEEVESKTDRPAVATSPPVVEWQSWPSESAESEPMLHGVDQYQYTWTYGTLSGGFWWYDGAAWNVPPEVGWHPAPPPPPSHDDEQLVKKYKHSPQVILKVEQLCLQGEKEHIAEAFKLLGAWNRAHVDDWIDVAKTDLKNVKAEGAEEKAETETAKVAPEVKLTVDKRPCRCRPLANAEGGYHHIYEILDAEPVITGVENSELLLRVPIKPEQSDVKLGMRQHGALSDVVAVPRVFNDAVKDGLYVVERVRQGCDPSQWGLRGRIGPALWMLTAPQQSQLAAIRALLTQNIRTVMTQGHELIPDFRPANVRFREDGTLVMIDFTVDAPEQREAEQRSAQDWLITMRAYVDQFAGEVPEAGTKANPEILDYLLKNLKSSESAALLKTNKDELFLT